MKTKSRIVFMVLFMAVTVLVTNIGVSAAWLNSGAPVLKYGSKGDYVWQLQMDLNILGFNLNVDSSFGPATESAVKSYQSQMGLSVDGSVGPATKASIIETVNNWESSQPQIPGTAALTKGKTGLRVRFLQKCLNQLGYGLEIDGSFGDATYNAVRRFQSDYNISVDGSCGPTTIRYINGAIKGTISPNPTTSTWLWPVDSTRITGEFWRWRSATNYNHRGVDIGCYLTNVYASRAGYIASKGQTSARGYYVVVDHCDGYYSVYQHLSNNNIKNVGDYVNRGDVIAVSGDTGSAGSYHLHFEIRKFGVAGLRDYDARPDRDFSDFSTYVNPSPTERPSSYSFETVTYEPYIEVTHPYD